jgi:LCP family protein required for cell wall assembly
MRKKSSIRYLDLDKEKKRKKRRRIKKAGILGGLLLPLVILVAGWFFWRDTFSDIFFSSVSFAARLVNPVKLRETDGRVNVLVLGIDTRSNGGLLNTDTLLVGSFSLTDGDPVLISIPRDLWVSYPGGGQGKINSAYAYGAVQPDGKVSEESGVNAAKETVEKVLGIPLHYWVIIGFDGFEKIINTLGGVKVCVDTAFDDYAYPVAGKEKAPLYQRYEHLHFDAGCQKMSGEKALKYSRSRMGTAGEGSDFARARRQQKVIVAVKEKLLSLSLVFKPARVIKLYNQFTETVGTNASVREAQRALEFLHKFQEDSRVDTLVLDPDSKLTHVPQVRSSYGGAYVIVPRAGSFKAIHKAVNKLLFGAKADSTKK